MFMIVVLFFTIGLSAISVGRKNFSMSLNNVDVDNVNNSDDNAIMIVVLFFAIGLSAISV